MISNAFFLVEEKSDGQRAWGVFRLSAWQLLGHPISRARFGIPGCFGFQVFLIL
jgi:hypothetical protein